MTVSFAGERPSLNDPTPKKIGESAEGPLEHAGGRAAAELPRHENSSS